MPPNKDPVCSANGTSRGKPWACDRPAVMLGLCDTHRKQQARNPGRAFTPIREALGAPAVAVSIRVTVAERDQLGANPSTRAGTIVREALARERKRAKQ
jgi:hypothetical protein